MESFGAVALTVSRQVVCLLAAKRKQEDVRLSVVQ